MSSERFNHLILLGEELNQMWSAISPVEKPALELRLTACSPCETNHIAQDNYIFLFLL